MKTLIIEMKDQPEIVYENVIWSEVRDGILVICNTADIEQAVNLSEVYYVKEKEAQNGM